MKKSLLLIATAIFSLHGFSQTIPDYVPTNGLVGWWPFNGNANDESGSGNNGTVTGATLSTDRNGNSNSAYSFDGVDDRISLIGSANIDFSGGYTFACWIKAESIKMASLVDKEAGVNANCNNENGFRINVRDNNDLRAETGCYGTGTGTADGSGYQIGEWIHCAGSVNTDDSVRLYINGTFVAKDIVSVGLSGLLNSKDIYFGQGTWGDFYETFDGTMDDIGVWNRALTDCEIQELYNSELSNIIINKTVTQAGNTLTANQTGSTYQWLDCDNGDAEISGETNQSFSPGISGNFKVQITLTDGACSKVDSSECYSFTFLGLEDTKNNLFKVYPNPTKEKLTIELKKFQKIEYTITDQLGKVIKEGNVSSNKQCIDISGLSNGVYIIKIGEERRKFVKE